MDSIVRSNALKDPNYAPYCMRCTGLVRMKKIEHMFWKCGCGAQHDERVNTLPPTTNTTWSPE